MSRGAARAAKSAYVLAVLLDLRDALHRADGLEHGLAIVLLDLVALLLEVVHLVLRCGHARAEVLRNGPRTTTSSLPADLRNAFVHATFLGLRFILKFLWHLDLQKRNTCQGTVKRRRMQEGSAARSTLASLRTNMTPCPG